MGLASAQLTDHVKLLILSIKYYTSMSFKIVLLKKIVLLITLITQALSIH